MSPEVLALVFAAALAHASWNLLAKGAEGGAAFVWWSAVAGSVLYLPLLVVVLAVDPGRLGWEALALMLGSGALHAVYFVMLQRGYAAGDLSVVYPLARGTGPLLSSTAAIAFLGERPGPLGLGGALLIVAAVFSLVRRSGAGAGTPLGRASLYAVLTGTATAAYTLLDKHAVGAAALSPVVYYWGANAANAALLVPVVARGGELRRVWNATRRQAVAVGLLSPLAYVLILYALERAPVSAVAPARESSIVVGTLLGTLVLHEGDTRRRLPAAAAILVGIVALTLA